MLALAKSQQGGSRRTRISGAGGWWQPHQLRVGALLAAALQPPNSAALLEVKRSQWFAVNEKGDVLPPKFQD